MSENFNGIITKVCVNVKWWNKKKLEIVATVQWSGEIWVKWAWLLPLVLNPTHSSCLLRNNDV